MNRERIAKDLFELITASDFDYMCDDDPDTAKPCPQWNVSAHYCMRKAELGCKRVNKILALLSQPTEIPDIPKPPLTGAELITQERERQMSEEGWTAEHDDEHTNNELARVGAIYALPAKFRFYAQAWPQTWSREWYKPTPQNRIGELTKAGALIAAEIDRLQRAKEVENGEQ
jgi:hypothetical protein